MRFSAFTESELEKFILHHAKLKTGDKLEGKVIDVRADSKVLIDFKGFRALAETEIQVEPGDIIRVVVVKRVPKLRLRLEYTELKPKDGVAPEARRVIEDINLSEGRSGDNWFHVEGLLKQLIGGSSAVNQLFPPGIGEELKKGGRPVKFNITGDDPHTLCLLLDTGRLGRIRVDFQHLPEEEKLSITFYIKNPEAREPMEANLTRIRRSMEKRFDQLILRVIYSPVRVGEFDTLRLEQQTGSKRVLDLNA